MATEVFIDSNIFLEIQLGQTNADKCELFLKNYEKNDHLGYINSFIFYSILLIIQHKTKDIEKSKNFVKIMNSFPGIKILHPTLDVIYSTHEIQSTFNLDFDDALVVASMRKLGIKNLVSYDHHFKKVNEINLLTPDKAITLIQK